MQKLFFILILLSILDTHAGSPKFEIRLNVTPRYENGYGTAPRIGVHSLGNKYVHGIELMNIGSRAFVQTRYILKDSFISKQSNKSVRTCFGLSYSLSRNIYFSGPQLIATIGLQAFAGMNRIIETKGPVFTDSQFIHSISTFDMNDIYSSYNNKIIKHAFHPSAALALVLGIKASINRRITLIPELRLPFIVHFNSGNNYDYLQPGLSLSLAYKVGIGKRTK